MCGFNPEKLKDTKKNILPSDTAIRQLLQYLLVADTSSVYKTLLANKEIALVLLMNEYTHLLQPMLSIIERYLFCVI